MKKYIVEDNKNFSEINDYEKAKAWLKDNCYFQYVEVYRIIVNEVMWKDFLAFCLIGDIWRKNIDASLLYR